MQGAVGIITLVLVTLLAIVFLTVLRRASAPAVPGATPIRVAFAPRCFGFSSWSGLA